MDAVVGIIPAGGRGSRLAPYPGPKELFPLGWQPYAVNGEIHRRPKVVSQYVVEGMAHAGVRQVLMIVSERKHDLLRYYGCGERFGLQVAYLFQEEPQGMVQAIDLAYPWVRGRQIVFGMPDTIIHPPTAFRDLLEAHHRGSAALTLGLFATDHPEKFGMVGIDSAGRVIAHEDKPARTNLTLMWGCAVWEASFTALIHEVWAGRARYASHPELIFGDVIDEALRRQTRVLGHYFAGGIYIDIGTYDEIIQAQTAIARVQP